MTDSINVKHKKSCGFIVFSLAMLIILGIGIGLIVGAVYLDNAKHDKFDDKYVKTTATITFINDTTYQCCKVTDCNKCVSDYTLSKCGDKIANMTTGACRSEPSCCQLMCYTDTTLALQKMCNPEFDTKGNCNQKCFCFTKNDNPVCESTCGNCHKVSIKYVYDTFMSSYDTTCSFTESDCVQNFIGSRTVNTTFPIAYLRSDPRLTYPINDLPGYNMYVGYALMIVAACLILLIPACVCMELTKMCCEKRISTNSSAA